MKKMLDELMLDIKNRFGIKPGEFLERRLLKICNEIPENQKQQWLNKLRLLPSTDFQWQMLIEKITIHETYFFRDPDLMNMLADEILPILISSRKSTKKLQVWSAACSTGEEAYDLVFLFLNSLLKFDIASKNSREIQIRNDWKLFIKGTDISNHVLGIAKEAIYSDHTLGSFRSLPTNWLEMFEKSDKQSKNENSDTNTLMVKRWIKEYVNFEYFNLMNPDPPINSIDLIFCRNVLIYFDDDVKYMVQKMLAKNMNPGGILILGASIQLLATEYFDNFMGKGGPWYKRNKVLI